MPVTTILDLRVKLDEIDRADEIFRRAVAETRQFPGCLSVTVSQDKSDRSRYVFIESWETVEADARYRAYRQAAGAIAGLPEVLAAVPEMTMLAVRQDL